MDDVVKVEVAQLSGEFSFEARLEFNARDVIGRVRGSKLTWMAAGLTITIPIELLEAHRDLIVGILEKKPSQASQ